MRTALAEYVGKMPLLMHADSIEWADRMEEWQHDPDNKGKSKPGDDRTPPWRWIGCLNYDDPDQGVVTIPSEYIMCNMMRGAADVPTGKGRKTFKGQSQSGIICTEFHWPLLIRGKKIKMADIQPMMKLKTFKEHLKATQDLGFSLFVKRVNIGGKKHIRVRPRFDDWSISGELTILTEEITDKDLGHFLEIGGRQGLGDWRPSAPKSPGPWGTFTPTILSGDGNGAGKKK